MALVTQAVETLVWKVVSDNAGSVRSLSHSGSVLISNSPQTAAQLKPKLKNINKKELVDALNVLLSKDLVKVAKTSDGKLTWTAVGISDAKT